MKAARIPRFGAPEVFTVDDIPLPLIGLDEALIRIKACGVNRMDTELRAGIYGGEPLEKFFFGKNIQLPHLPGIEPSGIVESVGAAVADLEPGTFVLPHSHLSCGRCKDCLAGYDNACAEIRVLGVQTPGQGGYAEYLAWPATHLIPFSHALSFETASALLVNYGPVWFGLLERAQLKQGETMVVTGAAGGCGHAALDIGRHVGVRSIAITRSENKAHALRGAGANDIVIDRGDESWADEVMDLTEGRGADCVLELVGAATWSQSIQAARSRGRVVVIGSHSGLNVHLNLGAVFSKNLSIEGITRANRRSMEEVVHRAEAGKLNPSIGHVLLLEQVSEAHRLMDTNAHTGKIVLSLD
ncbi:MAG: zinc-binding dehydrogenase [Gammaproteobacteria bacterium]